MREKGEKELMSLLLELIDKGANLSFRTAQQSNLCDFWNAEGRAQIDVVADVASNAIRLETINRDRTIGWKSGFDIVVRGWWSFSIWRAEIFTLLLSNREQITAPTAELGNVSDVTTWSEEIPPVRVGLK